MSASWLRILHAVSGIVKGVSQTMYHVARLLFQHYSPKSPYFSFLVPLLALSVSLRMSWESFNHRFISVVVKRLLKSSVHQSHR